MTSLIALTLLLPDESAADEQHLFLLSGQSNMHNLDETISFVPNVEAAFGKENVTVVKHALGGQPIRRWYKQWKSAEGYDPETVRYRWR